MAEALRVIGLEEALSKLQRLQQPNLDKASQRVIMAAARSLVAPIRSEAPVKSGRLRKSVSARRGKRTRDPSAIVGPRAPHRHLVIAGTKPHTVNAKRGGFMAFTGLFATSIHHPGSKPDSFVERGVQGQERRLEQFVARALEKELRL